MKTIKLFTLLFVATFFSCNKEDLSENNSTASDNIILKSNEEITSLKIENGLPNPGNLNNILVFPDMETYDNTISMLEEMVDAHIDEFNSGIPPETTDEEYWTIVSEEGFIEQQPMDDFESLHNFSSLRAKILNEQVTWLTTIGPEDEWNLEEDPNNHRVLLSSERTLLNSGSEMIVGRDTTDYVIYKYISDGGYLTIENYDLDALYEINQTGEIPVENPNVTVFQAAAQCKVVSNYANHYIVGQSGNYTFRMTAHGKLSLSFSGWPPNPDYLKSSFIARTNCYVSVGNLTLSASTLMTARINGQYYSIGNCSFNPPSSAYYNRTRRSSSVEVSFYRLASPAQFVSSIKPNEMYFLHKFEDLPTSTKTIDLYYGQ